MLSLLCALILGTTICFNHWACLTLPKHRYQPKIGDYIGPSDISTLFLGLFTTSRGSYSSLFKDINQVEARKARMVASLLLLSVIASLCSGLLKIFSSSHCRLAKRYKGTALLNVFAVVLNVGSLVMWFWFIYGFTRGKATLGAQMEFGYCIYVMLAVCGVLILVIGLDFISCRRRTHSPLDGDMIVSPAPSETSDEGPINLSHDEPPPYTELT